MAGADDDFRCGGFVCLQPDGVSPGMAASADFGGALDDSDSGQRGGCSCRFAAEQTDRLAGKIGLHGFVGRLRALAVGLG